jgi:hypothetical protein
MILPRLTKTHKTISYAQVLTLPEMLINDKLLNSQLYAHWGER